MAFGSVTSSEDALTLEFTDDAGELLSLVVWFLFGAAMIVPAFEHLEWTDAAFAVLTLTVVRMVPVGAVAREVGARSLDRCVRWLVRPARTRCRSSSP